jgi:hypothetical protein
MATTTLSPPFAPSAARPSYIPRWFKAFVNAVAASRGRQAAAELRRYESLIRESALRRGGSPAVGFDPAKCLPFEI